MVVSSCKIALFKRKLMFQIHVHNDLESLHKMVPKEVLPAEYGGDIGPLADISRELSYLINKLKHLDILLLLFFKGIIRHHGFLDHPVLSIEAST